MNTDVLEDLGLSNSEIKTYLTLLSLGSSSAGKILEKSELQNSVLHRALNSLIEKGLINYVLEGKRKIYQATNPENFHDFIEEKRRRFDEILPQLKARQSLSEKKEKATVYKGIRGIKEVYSILRETKGEYLTYGGGEECENRMETHWWMNHHRKRVDNKLPSRQVFDETVRQVGKEVKKLPLSKVKFLPADFASFQETVIVGDKIAITTFTENAYSFMIQDKSVADGYRKHFELLWKLAKS
jgi:sugar-specific transcriptional regulator TrmB